MRPETNCYCCQSPCYNRGSFDTLYTCQSCAYLVYAVKNHPITTMVNNSDPTDRKDGEGFPISYWLDALDQVKATVQCSLLPRKQLKYQGDCPCNMLAKHCDYHKDLIL